MGRKGKGRDLGLGGKRIGRRGRDAERVWEKERATCRGWGATHACGTEEGTRVRGGGIRG
jgi:hypothetical protein